MAGKELILKNRDSLTIGKTFFMLKLRKKKTKEKMTSLLSPQTQRKQEEPQEIKIEASAMQVSVYDNENKRGKKEISKTEKKSKRIEQDIITSATTQQTVLGDARGVFWDPKRAIDFKDQKEMRFEYYNGEFDHECLQLENFGGTCYLNSGLQVLYACCKDYSVNDARGPILKALNALFGKKGRNQEKFLQVLENRECLNDNLRKASDVRELIGKIFSKMDEQKDTEFCSLFQFKSPRIVKECVLCLNRDVSNPERKSFYQFAEGTGGSIQQCLDQNLHVQTSCIECKCPEYLRKRNQYKTIRYGEYPKFALIFTLPSKNFSIDEEIILPDSCVYQLKACAFSTVGHCVAVVRHSKGWYYCNDSSVQFQGQGFQQILQKCQNVNGLLFAYERTKEKDFNQNANTNRVEFPKNTIYI